MSFYHKSCTDCKCIVSTEWLERKQALAAGRPKKGFLIFYLHFSDIPLSRKERRKRRKGEERAG
jgi:hypothetical protein